jgi:hypothetical protein
MEDAAAVAKALEHGNYLLREIAERNGLYL